MGKNNKQTKQKKQQQTTQNQQLDHKQQDIKQPLSQVKVQQGQKEHGSTNKRKKQKTNDVQAQSKQVQSKVKNTKKQVQEQKSSGLKWQQIGQHDHSDDLWVVVKDNVYNLTKMAEGHPGGKKVLTQRAGKDATKTFASGNHPESVMDKKLPKYWIGKLQLYSKRQGWQSQQKEGGVDCLMTVFLSFAIVSFMMFLI